MVCGKKSGEFVTPGVKLGVIEEFNSGTGTYVENGSIYAQKTGQASIDMVNKRIGVRSVVRTPILPEKGQIVVGEVLQTQDKVATIRLLKLNETSISRPFSAILHVSFTSKQYITSTHDAFGAGDIIVAKVIGDVNQPYQLTTAERDLGVIHAYCSKCGGVLDLHGRQLVCSICGSRERRKISENYGKIV
ncbi:MAG: exosome complex RNA-binding protein Csl4 [Candidatus Bathyarchaeota archaeon]